MTESVITEIKATANGKSGRSSVHLDGKFAFSLDNEVILKNGLKPGRELSDLEVQRLTSADTNQKCFNSALRFLSYRPRSQSEVKQRLLKKGYQEEEIEETISRLKAINLLNDAEFAEYWKDNRNTFKPRGQRLLKLELRRKGVATDVIDGVVEKIDDTGNAYLAAIKRAKRLPLTDYRSFYQSLSGYLQRRGFNYTVTNRTIKQIWSELNESGLEEPPSGNEDEA